MNKVFIFDVDGTLTPSRIKMVDDFKEFFIKWSRNNSYWLVSGSDIEKMDEQVPEDIMMDAEGLFCCGGKLSSLAAGLCADVRGERGWHTQRD